MLEEQPKTTHCCRQRSVDQVCPSLVGRWTCQNLGYLQGVLPICVQQPSLNRAAWGLGGSSRVWGLSCHARGWGHHPTGKQPPTWCMSPITSHPATNCRPVQAVSNGGVSLNYPPNQGRVVALLLAPHSPAKVLSPFLQGELLGSALMCTP